MTVTVTSRDVTVTVKAPNTVMVKVAGSSEAPTINDVPTGRYPGYLPSLPLFPPGLSFPLSFCPSPARFPDPTITVLLLRRCLSCCPRPRPQA